MFSSETTPTPDIKKPSSLINAQQLKLLMSTDKSLLIIDVRPTIYYFTGHIPEAQNLWRPDYEADQGEYPFGGMRASQRKMERLLSRLGVEEETRLILYDNNNNVDAARLWWILKLYGHNQVVLLDGGLDAWKRQVYPIRLKSPSAPVTSDYRFNTQQANLQWLAGLEDVKTAHNDKRVVLLDVRSLSEATGQKQMSGAFRKGRIPHSVWLEYSNAMNDNDFFSEPELQALFAKKGVTPDHKIIVYCQSGVRSAHTHFVLKELLGFPHVSNYDGSWIEWSYFKELPVDTGTIENNQESL